MTASHDVDQRLRAFLVDGADRLPAEAYETIRASVVRHRRRRLAWGGGAFARWIDSPPFRIKAAAIAGILVLAVAVTLLPPGDRFGGPSAASSTASPGPFASAREWPSSGTWEHPLEVGRHRAVSAGVAFTFEVATPGWQLRREFTHIGIHTDRVATTGLTIHRPEVLSGGCAGLDRSLVGFTAEATANAMASIPGLDVLDRRELSVGGLAAWYAELRIRHDVACPTYLALWHDQGPVRNGTSGDHIRIWVVDVEGVPLLLESQTSGTPTAEGRAALDRLISTFEFEE